MKKKHLYETIQAAQTEEELKFYFANYFQTIKPPRFYMYLIFCLTSIRIFYEVIQCRKIIHYCDK